MSTYGPLFDAVLDGAFPELRKLARESTGQQLKEKGIKEVSEHNENWMEHAIGWSRLYVVGKRSETFTGEDIRLHIDAASGYPKHPNAWGALINTLIKRKIIVPTGEHRKMKDSRSHARSTPVYKAK